MPNESVESFARSLAEQTNTHNEWLAVMKYGMGTLLENQPLLIFLIDAEAKREFQKGAFDRADLPQRIFRELKLKIVPV